MRTIINACICLGLLLGIAAADHNLWVSVVGLLIMGVAVILDNIINGRR